MTGAGGENAGALDDCTGTAGEAGADTEYAGAVDDCAAGITGEEAGTDGEYAGAVDDCTGTAGEEAGTDGEYAGAMDDCAGAAAEEAGVDGASAELYPVTEQLDFATSSAGQVTTSQSTLMMSAIEWGEQEGTDVLRIVSARHPTPAETTAGL